MFKKIIFLMVLSFFLLTSICMARSYKYGGGINPKQFKTWQIVGPEVLVANHVAYICLINNTRHNKNYDKAVMFVYITPSSYLDFDILLAYALHKKNSDNILMYQYNINDRMYELVEHLDLFKLDLIGNYLFLTLMNN